VRVSTAEQERFVRPARPAAPRTPAPKQASVRAPSPAAPQPTLAQKPTAAKAPAKGQTSTRRTKTLAEQLLEEAREVQRARSGKKPAPEQSGSWLGRLFGGGAKPRPRSV